MGRQSGGTQVAGPNVRHVVQLRRVAHAIRGPVGIAVLAGPFAVALRLRFLHDPPYADEGGLLVVADHWHTGGPFLYGSFFVDRPPVLLAFFRLAAVGGGLDALRLLGLVLVLASVTCAGRAGQPLGGTRGAAGAAVTCAALLADPRIGAREIDAETVGVPLVLLAALLALEALRRTAPATRTGLLVAAGTAGGTALLVKQNLVDGLVVAIVLVVGTAFGRAGERRTAGRAGWVLLGAVVPLGGAVAWSTTSTGPHGLWYAMYGFRIAGSSSLFGSISPAQLARLQELGRASLSSGMAVLLVVSLAVLVRRRPDAVTIALVAMLATEVAGAAAGGYYWLHYLMGLVPATTLLAARAAGRVRRPLLVGVVVAATLASTVVAVVQDAWDRTPADRTEVGALASWLQHAARPGDSAVVLYGEASVFEATRLRPAYPFLWTLPQRVLDPHLSRLVHTLDHRGGPRFVVVRMALDSWGQDPRGRVGRALTEHYRPAAHVGGDVIYVRRGRSTQNAP